MKRYLPLAIPCLSALFFIACNRSGAISQPASITPNAIVILKPGDYRASLTFDGRERTFIVHLPPAISQQPLFPLVIGLHGGGGNAENVAKQTGMTAKADKENFVVVYPNGTGRLDDKLLTWNSGNCCGYALDEQIDDVGFLRALIAQIVRDYPVDPKKIFATGISNGGMMSYRLACQASDLVAAIAPVAGALNTACQPANPVSVIAFHGTDDRNVLYKGGMPKRQADSHPRQDRSVEYAMNFWSERNQCARPPQQLAKKSVVRDEYTGCAGNTGVVLYTLKGGGHSWPGGERMALFLDPPFKELSATDVMWEFFIAHAK